MKRRMISLVLAFVLLLTIVPVARAADDVPAMKEYLFTDSRGNEVIVPENAFATRVVSFQPGNPWTKLTEHTNTDNILGAPTDDKISFCMGYRGVIVLEFAVDIVDNEGMDIYVFEVGGQVEPTRVEVSADLINWVDVGRAEGSLSGVDLNGKVPVGARYHYVRLTDQGYSYSKWPGADITAVAGLNVKNIPFRDLPLDAYYYTPVTWAYDNEITFGVGNEKFNPTASCRRQDVVTYLWRLNGKPEATIDSCPFVDVPTNAYYYDAVLWGYENGVILGVDDTHFAPERDIKRCEFVALLHRNLGSPAYTCDNPFVDVKEGLYYHDPVLWALEVGITKGVTTDKFAPERKCTRAEVVTFLYRFAHLPTDKV